MKNYLDEYDSAVKEFEALKKKHSKYFDKKGKTIVPARLIKVIRARIQTSRLNPLKLLM